MFLSHASYQFLKVVRHHVKVKIQHVHVCYQSSDHIPV